ncbi:MAG TPA: hypothetical protein DCG47_00665 [Spirochaetaceae bacterium]|nr:hypothetical protein [Spirochaetaceae bacterium]
MKTLALSLALSLALATICLPVTLYAQAPFSFDVNIAPNSAGALEGSASLEFRWAPFAQSGLYFSASSLLETYDEAGGETTVVRSQKTLDAEILRTPYSLLSLPLGGSGSVYLSPVIMANGVILDEDRYGHGTDPAAYVYYLTQRVTWIKPLIGADLGLDLGILGIDAYYRTSWPFTLNESATGSVFHSITLQQDLSASDTGFETRLGGRVALRPASGWNIGVDLDWTRHIGVAVALAGNAYVYEMRSLDCAVTLAFPLGTLRPLIGAAFVQDEFMPLYLFDAEPYVNRRVRFIFGMQSK